MSPRTESQNKAIREKTRQQIIDAAFELFANDGFSNTSISAVAKKAGISKGLIYHYFDSKEAILEGIFNQLVQLGDEILAFPNDLSAADKILLIIDRTFAFIEQQPGMGRLMMSLALQPDAFQTLSSKIEKVNQSQMRLTLELFKELGYEDPEAEAYKIGALMDGVLMGYITMGERYPLQKIKQKIRDEYVSH